MRVFFISTKGCTHLETMSQLDADIQALQDELPEYISWIERQDASIEVYLANDSNEPFNLMLPDGYDASYPKGCVSCVCGGDFEELGEGTLAVLLERLNESMHFAPPSTLPTPSLTEASHMSLPRQPTAMSMDDSDGLPREDTTMSDLEEPMHPQLIRDTLAVQKRYGNDFITIREAKLLDKVFVTLMLDLSYLSASVCDAWGLAPKADKKPVCMEFEFSRSGYVDTVRFKVNCFQEGREWCGLAGQLENMLILMLDEVLKQRSDDMSNGVNPSVRALIECGFTREKAQTAFDAEGTLEAALKRLGGPKKAFDANKANCSKPGTLEACDSKEEKKRIPPCLNGLLVQILEYSHFRIKTCPEFCVICDQAHMFTTNMLKATVCSREVCAFAFQKLGVGAKAAKDLATDSGVVDLLVLMAKSAATSGRWEIIFKPYPTIFDPNDPKKRILHPDSKKIETVRKIFSAFPSIKDLYTSQSHGTEEQMVKTSKWAYPLLQWILSSNTSHLVKLRKEQRIKMVHTPHQYLLVSAAPAKQERFDALKKQYKTTFAYHGSATENWHSMYAYTFFFFCSIFYSPPSVCAMDSLVQAERSFR